MEGVIIHKLMKLKKPAAKVNKRGLHFALFCRTLKGCATDLVHPPEVVAAYAYHDTHAGQHAGNSLFAPHCLSSAHRS
jgi:hypothetical protein